MRRARIRSITICGLAMVASLGCEPVGRRAVVEPRPSAKAPPAAPREESSRVMARVNGQAIPMDKLHDALVRDHGRAVSQQLIADEVVLQELRRRNLPTNVTDRELEIENRRALSQLYQFDTSAAPEQLDSLLNQLLAQKNLTRRVWDASMARNVLLARLAERDPRATVTEEDIQRAFFEEYDGKFKARHIQVQRMVIAQEVMDKARKGEDFEKLAFHYSTNPSAKTGAWLPDIGPRTAPDTIPPPVVQAVRAMKTPGQISNIVQVGSNFHVLKLEEIIPPAKAKFSDVQGKLRYLVRDRNLDRLRPILMKELIDKAEIEYVDPVIRSKVKRGVQS
ncbi:MAG: peptidylprolyl isomerase [Phycisphaerae bacterium]|nr:peptidylprolyl isomerase [Phycisphaerae bacterium]